MRRFVPFPILLLLAACSAEFTRVPPGQSAMFARAKKAELVARPAQPAGAPAPVHGVEPPLPTGNEGETVQDFYALGTFCLQQGKNAEATKAFEKAVRLDPSYADAWNSLAICYQNMGENEKALDAFRRYKALAAQ